MFAIIQVSKKQYLVKVGDIIEVSYLDKKLKSSLTIKEVLLITKGKKVDIGQPYLKGASVACEIVDNNLGPKVYAFKVKRRKGYAKKIGHRQKYTFIKINEIKE